MIIQNVYSCRLIQIEDGDLYIRPRFQSNCLNQSKLETDNGYTRSDIVDLNKTSYRVSYNPVEVEEYKTGIIVSKFADDFEKFEDITNEDGKNLSEIIKDYMDFDVSFEPVKSLFVRWLIKMNNGEIEVEEKELTRNCPINRMLDKAGYYEVDVREINNNTYLINYESDERYTLKTKLLVSKLASPPEGFADMSEEDYSNVMIIVNEFMKVDGIYEQ